MGETFFLNEINGQLMRGWHDDGVQWRNMTENST
jgi:hypothetical protein